MQIVINSTLGLEGGYHNRGWGACPGVPPDRTCDWTGYYPAQAGSVTGLGYPPPTQKGPGIRDQRKKMRTEAEVPLPWKVHETRG